MAHVFIVALLIFMTQFILDYSTYVVGTWNFAFGIVIIYGIVTWFIDIHTAAAESL